MSHQLSFGTAVRKATPLGVFLLLFTLPACGTQEGRPGDGDGDLGSTGGRLGGDGDGDSDTEDDITVDDTLGDGDSDSQCDRSVRLAEVEVGAPAPFDVVIVADHSDSLSWSRSDLAAGLSDFLGQVAGHDVRFFVLTPTQYGESSRAARLPLAQDDVVQWFDPETGEAYTNAMTEYVQTCTIASGETIECPVEFADVTQEYELEGAWNFKMPEPVAMISPGMTETELDAQRLAISDAILGLGLGGASDEQPVCTLSRYIAQAPELLPEHAIFLILSDEDDQSAPEDCLATRSVSASLREAGSYYRMTAPAKVGKRLFDCVPENDQGEPVGDPVPMLWNIGSCTETRACNAEELALSLDACPASHALENCLIECSDGTVTCALSQAEVVSDPCVGPFDHGGDNWPSMEAYCAARHPEAAPWGNCTLIEAGGGLAFSHSNSPLTSATTMPQMVAEFRQQADAAFGQGGYSVQLVGFDPSFSCMPQAGQSYLDNLALLVGSPEDISPICGDYSGALAQAQDFATNLLENEYQLDLGSDEVLDRVRIISNDGTSRELTSNEYSYDPASGRLVIDQSAIHATDEAVDLEIGEDCVVL